MAPRQPSALPASRLAARLAEREPPGVVVLAGAERRLREEGLQLVVRAVLPDGDPGGALVRADAKRAEDRPRVLAAVDEVRTGSLFGGGKVVAIENADAADGPWVTDKRKNPLAQLAAAVLGTRVAGSVLVLLTARPVRGSGAVPAASLEKAGALVVDCRPLYDAPAPWERGRAPHDHELSRHLVERMRQAHGKRLGLEGSHALTRRIGSDLADLDDALRTLALYVGEREIVAEEDLAAALGETRSDPAWRLTDAFLAGDLPLALDLAEQAFRRGLPDARGGVVSRPEGVTALLLGALHATWRRLLGGAEGLARGDEPEALCRELGVPSFRASAFLDSCRKDPADLLERHAAFLAAEGAVKGGGASPQLALERLLVAWMAPHARPPRPVA